MARPMGWGAAGPRSLLFVPADRAAELLPKAQRSGADGIIVDLEDAVAPAAKDRAREGLRGALDGANVSVPVFVRVNPRGSPWHERDVAGLPSEVIEGVVLPKCESADEVRHLLEALPDLDLCVLPLIETPAGVLAADSVAGADARVVGIAFGAEDLAARLGVPRTSSGREVGHAREHVVLAASAAGVWALDSPSLETRRMETVRREARRARALGFTGKLLIHPLQVEPVHGAFRPSEPELAEARRVVAAFAGITGEDRGVGLLDGRMIDEPIVAAARRLIRRAEAYETEKMEDERA